MSLHLGWAKNAGLLHLSVGDVSVHLGVQPGHWKWLRSTEEYDRCMDYFGLGPLLLVCWAHGSDLSGSQKVGGA